MMMTMMKTMTNKNVFMAILREDFFGGEEKKEIRSRMFLNLRIAEVTEN